MSARGLTFAVAAVAVAVSACASLSDEEVAAEAVRVADDTCERLEDGVLSLRTYGPWSEVAQAEWDRHASQVSGLPDAPLHPDGPNLLRVVKERCPEIQGSYEAVHVLSGRGQLPDRRPRSRDAARRFLDAIDDDVDMPSVRLLRDGLAFCEVIEESPDVSPYRAVSRQFEGPASYLRAVSNAAAEHLC